MGVCLSSSCFYEEKIKRWVFGEIQIIHLYHDTSGVNHSSFKSLLYVYLLSKLNSNWTIWENTGWLLFQLKGCGSFTVCQINQHQAIEEKGHFFQVLITEGHAIV